MRTRFVARAGLTLPVQIVGEPPVWLVPAALDPAEGPVVSAMLEADSMRLSLRALAIALDRHALLLWARAIGQAYRGGALGDTVQPADAAEGLAALAGDPEAAPALAFWRAALAEGEPAGRLPEEREPEQSAPGSLHRDWEGTGPSPAQALALWDAWLCREAGLDRATIGVELSGRDADLADAVGCYARPLPCTLAPPGDLASAAGAAAAWLARAEDWMLVAPDPSGPATERGAFAYGFADETALPAPDWGVAVWRERAQWPCRLRLRLLPHGFALDYDAGRFASAEALADRFQHFAALALADPARPLATIPRLTPSTTASVAANSRGPALAPDCAANILDLIARAAAANPESPALTDPSSTVSYARFWHDTARIAASLSAHGLHAGDRVALVAPRGAVTITALIGVLRAGAVAVPIDPNYPPARQAALIANVGADLALVDAQKSDLACPTLTIAEALNAPAEPPPGPAACDGAYIIHTSGSTGQPKGVLVTHANLLASTRARFAYYDAPPATFLLTPSLSFDSSVAGLYWTLATGGRLLLPAPGDERDPGALARLIAAERPSHWLTVPALCQSVLTAAQAGELASLTDVIVAGEACPASLVAAHAAALPQARFHNEYGPTEATVWCTAWSWRPTDPLPDSVPIGRAIPGAATYLADPAGNLIPDGGAGEILVGGSGVAAGYLGRPEATAAAFLPDPFGDDPHARLYATGDLARRRADGEILYLGRIDRQLKLAGRRIEPGEIEARLDALPDVARSVVLVRNGRLTGYVETQSPFDAVAARAALATALPEWLIPEAIVAVDRFPTGANGKLDPDALPDPDRAARPAYRPPATPAEQALAEAIGAVIGVEAPGLDDDFFALGGDSLMALQVAAKLRGGGFALAVRSIFATPRLGELAALALPVAAQAEAAHDECPAPLAPIQRWFVARDLPDPSHYNQAVAFEIAEPLSLERLTAALAQVAARHPALRSAIERHDGGWRQRPLAEPPLAPGWFDLRSLPAPGPRPPARAKDRRAPPRPRSVRRPKPARRRLPPRRSARPARPRRPPSRDRRARVADPRRGPCRCLSRPAARPRAKLWPMGRSGWRLNHAMTPPGKTI